ncbi:MAG: hypothetical protein IKX40_10125 [Thermoguttaceae bacterium]|nr:hypothetical protein [Thermoguttaceae bacterium]
MEKELESFQRQAARAVSLLTAERLISKYTDKNGSDKRFFRLSTENFSKERNFSLHFRKNELSYIKARC